MEALTVTLKGTTSLRGTSDDANAHGAIRANAWPRSGSAFVQCHYLVPALHNCFLLKASLTVFFWRTSER
jgi:hypothetical protein